MCGFPLILSGLHCIKRLATFPSPDRMPLTKLVIGPSGLSDDDDGKNDGRKWKLAESVRLRDNIFTLVRYLHFQNSRE